MKKASRHNIILWLVILVAGIVAIFLMTAVWVNSNLAHGTYSHGSKTAYLYDYELTQTPAKPVSGQPITFRFRVSESGHPVQGRDFTVGITHAYGIGVSDRVADRFETVAKTDGEGFMSFIYTPKLEDLFPYSGFGIYASPELSSEEEKLLKDKIANRDISANTNTAVNYDMPSIYPKWMSWFLWR